MTAAKKTSERSQYSRTFWEMSALLLVLHRYGLVLRLVRHERMEQTQFRIGDNHILASRPEVRVLVRGCIKKQIPLDITPRCAKKEKSHKRERSPVRREGLGDGEEIGFLWTRGVF